jgi:predicted TIM-barrel fold metal-dependent hydrolase
VVDRDLAICDPHHHLWDRDDSVYMLPELRADTTGGHRIVSTVYVECGSGYRSGGPAAMAPVGETEWVAAMGTPDGALSGIVGFADLTLGAGVAEVLDAHVEAGRGRFRGVRHSAAWDPSPEIRPGHVKTPPGMLRMPVVHQGIAALGRAGLHFEAWLYHPQLPELVEAAKACPNVPIVLDHLGGPIGIGPYAGRRDEVREVWRSSMAEVARCDNVALKLGGIGMPVFGTDWHRRAMAASSDDLVTEWGADIRWCLERFGPARCMFESNFPVDRRSCSYRVLWNAFKHMTVDLSPSERGALFHDTAASFYRLGQ